MKTVKQPEKMIRAKFLETTAGKAVAAIVVIGGLVAAYYAVRGSLGPSDAVRSSRQRMFVCSETMKSFAYEVSAGETYPVPSPFTGRNTGYPAEACYWTKDGKIRDEPYYVLLNQLIGQPGPTFCPDCGRLVVGHNPHPRAGDNPPPTRAQLTSGH